MKNIPKLLAIMVLATFVISCAPKEIRASTEDTSTEGASPEATQLQIPTIDSIENENNPITLVTADFLINGVINAQVENGSALNSIISELRVLGNHIFIVPGIYADGGFTLTLPKTPNADILFEGFYLQSGTVSDQNAKMFFFSKIGGYDRKGSHAATFSLYDDSTLEPLYHEGVFEEMSGFRNIACFWYSDRDVIVNGRSDGQNYNLNLKRGWNIVYEQCFEPSGTSNYSTTAPADWNGKWMFDRKNEE